MAQQLGLQFGVVLNDAVVDADHIRLHGAGPGPGAVAADMGMGIGLARLSVGGPAGMPDPTGSCQRGPVVCLDCQIPELSGCFYHFGQIASVPYREPRRVIAPVFQSGQAVQQDRRRLVISRKPNNSAHSVFPPNPFDSVR